MLFLTASNYTAFLHWFLTNISDNEALAAVFMMWLNTEVMYTTVVAFFHVVETSNMFQEHKIRKQPSDKKMFRDAILFKPIAWLVDIPIYYLSFCMMNWTWWWDDAKTTHRSPLDPLPDSKTLFSHVLILTAIFDLLFYFWHRALHTRPMWKFHKKHHEVKVSFSCANDHESVVELAGNILWKMIPPALLGCHVYTVCLFRATVKFFALLHHSGFELPVFRPLQRIPGLASPSYHDHHHYHGYGNFGGVFNIWDKIFGTDVVVR